MVAHITWHTIFAQFLFQLGCNFLRSSGDYYKSIYHEKSKPLYSFLSLLYGPLLAVKWERPQKSPRGCLGPTNPANQDLLGHLLSLNHVFKFSSLPPLLPWITLRKISKEFDTHNKIFEYLLIRLRQLHMQHFNILNNANF